MREFTCTYLTRVAVIVGTACLIRAARDHRRARDVIGALCGDMVFWGNREGGIPDTYWEDYRAGCALVGLMAVPPLGKRAATGECDAAQTLVDELKGHCAPLGAKPTLALAELRDVRLTRA